MKSEDIFDILTSNDVVFPDKQTVSVSVSLLLLIEELKMEFLTDITMAEAIFYSACVLAIAILLR